MTTGLLISSLLISFISVKIFQNEFLKRNIIDKVNNRSSHSVTATRTGGISLFISLFLISIYFYFSGFDLYNYSLLLPLSILLVVGFYDDIYQVDFKLKFIFQIIVAKIIIDNGLIIDNMHGILGINELNRIFAQLFSIFIIVAIINAINFIDGLDGLAMTIVSIFIIGYEFFSSVITSFKYISIIILASFIPLSYFNFRNNKKVFLGDSGSLFLGGLISIYVLDILSPTYLIKPKYDINKVLFVISILFYPIIDISRVFILRIIKGKSPFIADKNHIHHYLNNKYKRHWKVSSILAIMTLLIIVVFQLLKID